MDLFFPAVRGQVYKISPVCLCVSVSGLLAKLDMCNGQICPEIEKV